MDPWTPEIGSVDHPGQNLTAKEITGADLTVSRMHSCAAGRLRGTGAVKEQGLSGLALAGRLQVRNRRRAVWLFAFHAS